MKDKNKTLRDSDELVELGQCRSPHGIRGGFTFFIFNSEDELLLPGRVLTLLPLSQHSSMAENGQEYTLSQISRGNKVICYLQGVESRDEVEKMVPFSFSIPRKSLPAIADDEVYLNDLIGLSVVDHRDKMRKGVVEDLYDNGAQPVLVIKADSGNFEIPFVNAFCPHLDLEKGEIEVIFPQEY